MNFYKLEHPPLETAEVKYPKIHALNIPAVLRVGAAALGFCALTFPTAKTAETHPEPESKVRILYDSIFHEKIVVVDRAKRAEVYPKFSKSE